MLGFQRLAIGNAIEGFAHIFPVFSDYLMAVLLICLHRWLSSGYHFRRIVGGGHIGLDARAAAAGQGEEVLRWSLIELLLKALLALPRISVTLSLQKVTFCLRFAPLTSCWALCWT
jgi:hypothetical protein